MSRTTRPIFVLGMLQRSGTNFLRDLLIAHPACAGSEVLAEDFLLHHAGLLTRYVRRVQWHWAKPLFPDEVERLRDELLRTLGEGLVDFVGRAVGGERPVLKTPSVRNLELFEDLFEGVGLLLIVRDGRAMVESGMRSFDWDFEQATRQWAEAADAVLAFKRRVRGRNVTWRMVRYEDLVTNLRSELTAVFETLDLDPGRYDFDAAESLPVKGSSTYRGGEAEDVHWNAVARDEDFRPLERWAAWARSRHERFNWLAGTQLRALGYEPRQAPDAAERWVAWNRWKDARWLAERYGERVKRVIRARIPGRRA